jgi:hypothetical protein
MYLKSMNRKKELDKPTYETIVAIFLLSPNFILVASICPEAKADAKVRASNVL